MIAIGSQKINTNIILAPLSGCSDLAFRLICREHGAKFCFYEMVDCNSLTHNHAKKNDDIIQLHEKDHPVAAQLVGAEPERMARAAKILLDSVKPAFLDINFACPAKKIVKKKAGSYLLQTPQALFDILAKVVRAVDIPVTVKMRLGYDTTDVKAIVDIAKGCQRSGAAALTVHGRTRAQGYSGDIDYAAIKAIKEAVKVPVFGSGNIFTPILAEKMLRETGCDGVFVARGAFGNPWIFRDIESYLTTGTIPQPPNLTEKKKTLIRHLSYIETYKRTNLSSRLGCMRKVSLWYLKGFENAARMRERICRTKSFDDLLKLIDSVA